MSLEMTEVVKEKDTHADVLRQFNYDFIEYLGRGGGGKVFLAEDIAKGRKVAVKVTLANNPLGEGEWKHWSRLQHPNIIRLYDKFVIDNERYYIMEYASKHTLYEWLRLHRVQNNFPYIAESRMVKWTRQLLEAVRYLHNNNLYHFDIKSSNILLDRKLNLKLSDFGTMKALGEDNIRHNGCRFYRSPEILQGFHPNVAHDFEAVDVWAIGATLLRVFSGGKLISYRNFTCSVFETKMDIVKNIEENVEQLKLINMPSEGLREFLIFILKIDPESRPSCEMALKHWWITSGKKPTDQSENPPTKRPTSAPTEGPVRKLRYSKQITAKEVMKKIQMANKRLAPYIDPTEMATRKRQIKDGQLDSKSLRPKRERLTPEKEITKTKRTSTKGRQNNMSSVTEKKSVEQNKEMQLVDEAISACDEASLEEAKNQRRAYSTWLQKVRTEAAAAADNLKVEEDTKVSLKLKKSSKVESSVYTLQRRSSHSHLDIIENLENSLIEKKNQCGKAQSATRIREPFNTKEMTDKSKRPKSASAVDSDLPLTFKGLEEQAKKKTEMTTATQTMALTSRDRQTERHRWNMGHRSTTPTVEVYVKSIEWPFSMDPLPKFCDTQPLTQKLLQPNRLVSPSNMRFSIQPFTGDIRPSRGECSNEWVVLSATPYSKKRPLSTEEKIVNRVIIDSDFTHYQKYWAKQYLTPWIRSEIIRLKEVLDTLKTTRCPANNVSSLSKHRDSKTRTRPRSHKTANRKSAESSKKK